MNKKILKNPVMKELIAEQRSIRARLKLPTPQDDAKLAVQVLRCFGKCLACGKPVDFEPRRAIEACSTRREFIASYGAALGAHYEWSPQCRHKMNAQLTPEDHLHCEEQVERWRQEHDLGPEVHALATDAIAKAVERVSAAAAAQDMDQDAMLAINQAEVNFHLHPDEFYKGIMSLMHLYDKDRTLIESGPPPDDVDGDSMQSLMWEMLDRSKAVAMVAYWFVDKASVIWVLVMTHTRFQIWRCPILPYKQQYSLGDWSRHHLDEPKD
jgi:hypothetical protein